MLRTTLSAGALLALTGLTLAGFTPTSTPVSPDGKAAVIDLPTSQHMKNVGGRDGAGLCVFTSVEHAARWQNVGTLDGFQRWMTRRPGGGWPQKLDEMIAAYAREQGVSLPPYIQHTGGDEQFLELALHTDRMPCVTYAGRDDFYRSRIAHMVNLAHLDSERAAIIDNNRPGVWVWMTRAEFLQRWRDNDGGWAVVLLDSPPPPHPGKAVKVEAACICGDSCKCKAGECPNKCPVTAGFLEIKFVKIPFSDYRVRVEVPTTEREFLRKWRDEPVVRVVGQCANGQCPAPAPVAQSPGPGWQWSFVPGVGLCWNRPADTPAKVEGAAENYGVSSDKIHSHPSYSINGVEVSRPVALAAMGGSPLSDDSDRWHLTCVGNASLVAAFTADVAGLSAETRGKLLVKTYSPDRWEVAAFALPVGVNLRKPSPVRTAADVGTIPAADYTPGKLGNLLSAPGGPVVLPTPVPQPVPTPDPTGPNPAPAPQPAPVPAPQPAPNSQPNPWLALVVAAVALILSLFKKKVS